MANKPRPLPKDDVGEERLCPNIKANSVTIRQEDYLAELNRVAKKGYTLQQIATHFGVDRVTLYQWTKKFPEVQGAVDSGKEIADERVEQALYESCFPHDEKEITIEKDADGNIVKQIIRTKHVPANTTAIQYWLSNRKSENWKARQQLDVQGVKDGPPVIIVNDLEATKDLPFDPLGKNKKPEQ